MTALSIKQRDSIVQSNGHTNIWEGAVRSGKTVASMLRWLIFVNQAPPGALVMIGRTRETVSRNVIAELQNEQLFGDLAAQVHYRPGAERGTILGRTVYVLGANDSQADAKIRGLTVAGAYVDEITTLPESFFIQLLNRLISVRGSQLFGTTNPDSPAHWFKKKFLDRIETGDLPSWRRFSFVMDDNPILLPEQKQRAREQLTGLWRRRFIDGEWVAAEGAIFDMWDSARHVISWDELPPIHRFIAIGMDFGTRNASSAILLGMTRDGQLYLVDEWRYDSRATGKRLTTGQQSMQFRDWLYGQKHAPQPNDPRFEHIFIDPSAAPMTRQLFEDQVTGVVDADNRVNYGVMTMATLLDRDELLVSDRCQGFISEAPGYAWDDKAAERGHDTPLKVADHSIDAARYAICSSEPIWGEARVDRVEVAAMRHRYEDAAKGGRELDLMTAPM